MSAEKRSLEEMSLGEAPACVTPDGSRQRPNQIIKCFYGPVNYAIEDTHHPKTFLVMLGLSRTQQARASHARA